MGPAPLRKQTAGPSGNQHGGMTAMPSDTTPAPSGATTYQPNEILLYGVKLNDNVDYADIPFDPSVLVKQSSVFLRMQVSKASGTDDTAVPIARDKVSIAVAYGYGFEGACYRFDRPRLLLFKPQGDAMPAQGCGFDGFDPPYKMWRITSKTMLLELASTAGTAEDLILAANLPGNRPPNTYGNHMQLAHRGGRLNRGGD